ncbi:MAG: hypothetical protein IKP00_13430 [Victivallales bacterium]|nr:hypothetical protein [Victivallales bacterium]
MKRCLAVLLIVFSAQLLAVHAPRLRPRCRTRPVERHGPRRMPSVPWQTIVAGGAAVSGVVFAYKVAEGIQSGMEEAARESPDRFLDRCGGIGGTVQIASAVIVIAGIAYLAWRLAIHGKPPERRELPPPSDHEPSP